MQKIDRVEVVQYDPNWPRIFEAEAVQIKKALVCNCIAPSCWVDFSTWSCSKT